MYTNIIIGGSEEKESTSIDQILGSLSQGKETDSKGIQINDDTFLDKDGQSHSGPVCNRILSIY